MDLELTDYDQVDEVKLMLDNREQTCHDGSTSRFVVTLSSCSDQGSMDEVNSESDFVFLPAPAAKSGAATPAQDPANKSKQQQQLEQQQVQQREQELAESVPADRAQCEPIFRPELKVHKSNKDLCQKGLIGSAPIPTNPLLAINRGQQNSNQGNNPFGNAPPRSPPIDPIDCRVPRKQRYNSDTAFECVPDSIKPIGVLELSPAIANSKMAELMQQIVIRSDSILIAIPCNYCFEPVTCPPADISNWLNHMSIQHNCKVCPICERLVGLGPTRDLEIMRRHVVEDLDENWLEKRANRVTFTFGLQQLWFPGNQCNIKEARYK